MVKILWSDKYILAPTEVKKGQKKAHSKTGKSLLWTEFYRAGIVTVGDLFNDNNELIGYKYTKILLDKFTHTRPEKSNVILWFRHCYWELFPTESSSLY